MLMGRYLTENTNRLYIIKKWIIGHTVAEAGWEAILPLNRQVVFRDWGGVLRSVREKSLREITEPIRRMWEEDSIRKCRLRRHSGTRLPLLMGTGPGHQPDQQYHRAHASLSL